MKSTTLLALEKFARPLISPLHPRTIISQYSQGRQKFLKAFEQDTPTTNFVPLDLSQELWGMNFITPLMNAAGMSKNGELYNHFCMQGAGGFLGGTSTWNRREGNTIKEIYLPFVTYPLSGAASNCLGLPNHGDLINSQRVASFQKVSDFPIGWSLMISPDIMPENQLLYLVRGMKLYQRAGVDFLELNESCPNTDHSDEGLEKRLRYISENFLRERKRKIPVIIKFSIDTKKENIPYLLDTLFDLNFDGVNFGNTSKDYNAMRIRIHPREQKLFDYFTQNIGGGVSGAPLKEKSLEICACAVEYRNKANPPQEFHIIRTGGIDTVQDIIDSNNVGVSLNQWFSGYYHNFAKYGHNVYRNFFSIPLEKGAEPF